MHDSIMHPPNFQSLGDNVIGSVVAQRCKQSSQTSHSSNERNTDAKQGDKSHLSREEVAAMLQFVIAEQRELHRARQQRYRKKFNAKAEHLQEAVTKLREEIKQLSLQRQSNIFSVPTEMTPWKLVIEYFRVFRNGFQEESGQKTFLQTAMAPHVSFNGGYGVDAVLEDWRMISLHHEEMEIQLAVIEPDSENSLIASINGMTTVSEDMLRVSLPHLVGGLRWDSLVEKLVGQRLVIPSIVRFEWEDSMARIVSVHFQADMLTPLMKLLNDLQDASSVLNSSLNVHHWSQTKARIIK